MALCKPANGGAEKPWHQDLAYFSVNPFAGICGVSIALDAATGKAGARIPVGVAPRGLTVSPDGKWLLFDGASRQTHRSAMFVIGVDQETGAIEAVALRELREETGFELAEGGELISLGDYFTSPGFTDERGYFFLARAVRPSAEGHTRDESESILDCQAFSAHELSRMIDTNEIRDANTLGICARLVARGLLSLARE